MKNDLLLSICIPTYNRSKELKKTLQLLLENSFKNLEIIVSDNASSDDTSDVVKEFNDPRIRYYRNDVNYGATFNIIKVLEYALGEYVVYLSDEDNLFIDNILFEIVQNLHKKPLQIFGVIYDFKGEVYHPVLPGDYSMGPSSLYHPGFGSTYLSGMVVRRDSIDFNEIYYQYDLPNHGYLNHVYPQNFILNMNLLKGLTVVSERAFASMRDHGENFVLPVSGSHYFSLENRLLQFETNVRFVTEFVPNDLKMKRKIILRLYNELLSTIFSFNTIYKDERTKSYFELSSNKINNITFLKRFHESGKIVDIAFLNENILLKVKLKISKLLVLIKSALYQLKISLNRIFFRSN
jgi:glycosyltransferase involved in cell wall biosynthesis